MSAGSTSQSYATVAPSVGPVDSFARKPLPPFWGYQDEPPVKVDVAPVDVGGTPANDWIDPIDCCDLGPLSDERGAE